MTKLAAPSITAAPKPAAVNENAKKLFNDTLTARLISRVRMVGIVFARPSSQLAKSEIIPQLADWDHRSGNHIDFYFAGYSRWQPSGHASIDFISVSIPGHDNWFYSPDLFDNFRREYESKTTWRSSGGCDLLLTNARYNEPSEQVTIDFTSTIICQLDSMIEDKAIPSVERFFESIFRFAESSNDKDPTWGFSQEQGLAVAGSALKRVVLSLLPKNLGKEIKKAEHFAIRDVAIR